jgi:serpin B
MQLHPKPNNSTSGPSSLFAKTIKTLSQKIDDSVGIINTFYSPMSIALALAMVYEGTDLK